MNDITPYLICRALAVDVAEADGTIDGWPVIELDLERGLLGPLMILAAARGVDLEDLIAAILTWGLSEGIVDE